MPPPGSALGRQQNGVVGGSGGHHMQAPLLHIYLQRGAFSPLAIGWGWRPGSQSEEWAGVGGGEALWCAAWSRWQYPFGSPGKSHTYPLWLFQVPLGVCVPLVDNPCYSKWCIEFSPLLQSTTPPNARALFNPSHLVTSSDPYLRVHHVLVMHCWLLLHSHGSGRTGWSSLVQRLLGEYHLLLKCVKLYWNVNFSEKYLTSFLKCFWKAPWPFLLARKLT